MAKKTTKTKPKSIKETTPTRRLKMPKRPNRHWRKRIKSSQPSVKNAFKLFGHSLTVIKKDWKLFGGITFVYAVLTLILVQGFSSGANISGIKDTLSESLNSSSQLTTSVALFGVLLSSSGTTTSQVAGAYQSIITVLTSLAIIWALRQRSTTPPQQVTVKQAYYRSTGSLIPFLLVILIIGLQFIPLLVGATIYGTVINTGLATNLFAQLACLLLFFVLSAWSLYMVSSSIFALYIVTLPDATPLKALRSAKKLVRYRRWEMLRKVIFLPLALLICAVVIMLPFIMYVPTVAEWLFFMLSMVSLVVLHSYVYSLYRELL